MPKYKLELRASPFFELFLLDALNAHYKPLAFRETIIPEFPIKKPDNYQSNNPDFFALSKDRKLALLIELKTDMRSLSDDQSEYLKRASKTELKDLIDGIISIRFSENADKEKYAHLLKCLSGLGLVNGEENTIKEAGLKPKIVYIQPKHDQATHKDYADYIYFKEFADAIKGRGAIAERFAKSLIRWIEPAGS